MRKIISNTSCLIVLDNIGMLDILELLYGKIIISREVYIEYGKKIPEWIEIREVNDRKYLDLIKNFVDLGEASTIALAMEIENSITILDDLKARKLAKKIDVNVTGTLGVIVKARKKNIIPSIKDVIGNLKNNGFRISENLEKEILEYDNK